MDNKDPTLKIEKTDFVNVTWGRCSIVDNTYIDGAVTITFTDSTNGVHDYKLTLHRDKLQILKTCIDAYLVTKGKI